jgi:ferredoxin-thioredoxin reductase catalytic subunit
MIQILRKEGWVLNPNDKVVNSILRMCEKNDGICPCMHDNEEYEGKDLHCPCTDYTVKNKCVCGLYKKVKDEV